MRNVKFFSSIIVIFVIFLSFNNDGNSFEKRIYQNDLPKKGLIRNEETAIKIAEAIWLNVYGDHINDSKPFKAELIDDKIWKVYSNPKEIMLGGTFYIEIRKSDCKVIKINAGK